MKEKNRLMTNFRNKLECLSLASFSSLVLEQKFKYYGQKSIITLAPVWHHLVRTIWKRQEKNSPQHAGYQGLLDQHLGQNDIKLFWR